MPDISESQAAADFDALLDEVEKGATFTVHRDGEPVAHIRPIKSATGADMKAVLARHPADPEWMDDIRSVRALLRFD
ncbi:MAG: prevent-host-death protein [Acidimicrobiia bacterium]